jgi:hypothetical protein
MPEDRESEKVHDDAGSESVLTPGGPRPRSKVHRVGPCEIVVGDRGTGRVASAAPHKRAAADLARAQGLVLTPGGFRHPSLLHRLDAGEGITRAAGRLQKLILATGVAVDIPAGAGPVPALGSGWITDATFVKPAGIPAFSSFITTWKVPPAPPSHDGQTIFLFNAFTDSSPKEILQPVLQWGPSSAGGGEDWEVACWYIDASGNAFYHDPVAVNEGDILVGVIALTGQSGSMFSYDCFFQGIGSTKLSVQNIPEQTVVYETLECYSIQKCVDYPNAYYTAMRSIELKAGGQDIAPRWKVENRVTDCGQHTIIVSDASPGGEVDLFYSKRAPSWNLQRITGGVAVTFGPPATAGPFVCDFLQQQHFAYRDGAGNIWDSWYDDPNNKWNLQQINGSAGLTTGAQAAGAPFLFVFGQQQHFVYRDAAGTIWDSWYDGVFDNWNLQQINLPGGRTNGPAAAGDPFVSVYNNQQHFAYTDGGGHIQDAWYDGATNSWNLQQINLPGGRTNGPPAVDDPFVSVYNNQQHFTYRDSGGGVQDAWYDGATGSWNLQQINLPGGRTNGPAAVGNPFVSVYNNQQHFAYRDGAGHIEDAWYDGATGSWNLQQINLPGGRTGGPQAASDPFVWTYGQQQHFTYPSAGGTIFDAWYDGASNGWKLQQINTGGVTNGQPAAAGPFVCVFLQQQHIAYLDATETIRDAWYDGATNTWNLQQINAGGLTAGPPSINDPFASVFGQQEHIGYRDDAGAIWDAWYDGATNKWNLQRINAGGVTAGPPAVGGPFIWVYQQQQHFTYRDFNEGVWDAWYDGASNKWSLEKLNEGSLTNGPPAAGDVFVSVFGQQQHIAYLDGGGIIRDVWYNGATNKWDLQQINGPGGRTTGVPAAGGPFVCVFNQQQHFAYRDSGGTIRDAWYDGATSKWNLQQINGAGGRTTGVPAAGGPFVCVFNQQQHFAYRDSGGTIWDAWYDGATNKWNLQQINAGGTAVTNGPAAGGNVFVCVFNEQQHFTYRDLSETIWDAWYDGADNSWNLQQINLAAPTNGGLTFGPGTIGVPFVWTYTQQNHFTYRDSGGTMWDAWYQG